MKKKAPKPKWGGPRIGAGAKPKNPETGNRKHANHRLDVTTVERIKSLSRETGLSQGEVIDRAVAQYLPKGGAKH